MLSKVGEIEITQIRDPPIPRWWYRVRWVAQIHVFRVSRVGLIEMFGSALVS